MKNFKKFIMFLGFFIFLMISFKIISFFTQPTPKIYETVDGKIYLEKGHENKLMLESLDNVKIANGIAKGFQEIIKDNVQSACSKVGGYYYRGLCYIGKLTIVDGKGIISNGNYNYLDNNTIDKLTDSCSKGVCPIGYVGLAGVKDDFVDYNVTYYKENKTPRPVGSTLLVTIFNRDNSYIENILKNYIANELGVNPNNLDVKIMNKLLVGKLDEKNTLLFPNKYLVKYTNNYSWGNPTGFIYSYNVFRDSNRKAGYLYNNETTLCEQMGGSFVRGACGGISIIYNSTRYDSPNIGVFDHIINSCLYGNCPGGYFIIGSKKYPLKEYIENKSKIAVESCKNGRIRLVGDKFQINKCYLMFKEPKVGVSKLYYKTDKFVIADNGCDGSGYSGIYHFELDGLDTNKVIKYAKQNNMVSCYKNDSGNLKLINCATLGLKTSNDNKNKKLLLSGWSGFNFKFSLANNINKFKIYKITGSEIFVVSVTYNGNKKYFKVMLKNNLENKGEIAKYNTYKTSLVLDITEIKVESEENRIKFSENNGVIFNENS